MALRRFRDLRDYAPQLLLVAVVAFGSWACGASSSEIAAPTTLESMVAAEPTTPSTGSPDTPPPTTPSTAPSTAPSTPPTTPPTRPNGTAMPTSTAPEFPDTTVADSPLVVDADSFVALADMAPVRGFFVDNLLGDLAATIAVAGSPTGGVYPVGSVVQLIPGEVMVKREAGFSPTTKDWEFFELDVDANGSTIRVRGGDEVVNRFGGSCASCHEFAEPEWDFICEQDHGCEPLPFDRDTIEAIQDADPRPRR